MKMHARHWVKASHAACMYSSPALDEALDEHVQQSDTTGVCSVVQMFRHDCALHVQHGTATLHEHEKVYRSRILEPSMVYMLPPCWYMHPSARARMHALLDALEACFVSRSKEMKVCSAYAGCVGIASTPSVIA